MPEHFFADDLPLLALGALQGEERRRVEEHLASGCDLCETELQALREAVDLLPYSLRERRPPEGMKARVLAGVDALGPSGEPPAAVPAPPGRGRGWRLALEMAALVSLGVATILAVTREKEIEILRSERQSLSALLNAQERELGWMKDPAVQMADLKGVEGPAEARFLFHSAARQGLLVARRLPPPPEGKCYQLWVFVAGEPSPAGVFETGAEGSAVLSVPHLECLGRNPDRFAVSIEPKGGMARPTGSVILLGSRL